MSEQERWKQIAIKVLGCDGSIQNDFYSQLQEQISIELRHKLLGNSLMGSDIYQWGAGDNHCHEQISHDCSENNNE